MFPNTGSTNTASRPAKLAPPHKRPRHWKLIACVALAMFAAGWYFWGGNRAEGQKTAYLAEAVTRGQIEDTITAVGKLNAVRSVNVGAQVSGQLISVKVKIGDHVKENQLVAEIDPTPSEKRVESAQAQIDNLYAQLQSKQAQLKLKELNAARQKTLLASRGVSQSTVDQANAELAMAEADVKALKAQIRQQEAQLDSYKVDLGYTNIYSPMTGTVVDQSAKEGETLNAVQSAPTVITVADLSTMTVEAQVSEADISRLKIGMSVYFTLLGQPHKKFRGTLRQIKPTPQTENNVVLYNALFDVPNPDGELMINMSAQVYFVIGEADNVLLVPVSALIRKNEGTSDDDDKASYSVKVVKDDGSLEIRPVEVGVKNRVQAEIKSGLREGEKVVVTSASSTADGDGKSGPRGPRPGGPFF